MLNINNEYDNLRKVLMASAETFHVHEPINSTQEYYYFKDPPHVSVLLEEQQAFVDCLLSYGVDIVWAEKRTDCTNQLNTRDVAFVAKSTFVVCSMKEKERKNEHLGLSGIIDSLQPSDVILRPENLFLEGGDIVLDNKVLFVGISQRTDLRGLEWLKTNFSDNFEVTPVFLSPGFLHLDCVFNVISDEYALVLNRGITEESLRMINKRYKVISIHEEEQGYLPTNVFVVNHNNIIADPRCIKTNEMMRIIGKNVHEIKFSEISKIGGSFRCSTCPLVRCE